MESAGYKFTVIFIEQNAAFQSKNYLNNYAPRVKSLYTHFLNKTTQIWI